MTRRDPEPPQRPGPLPPGRGRDAMVDAVAAGLDHLPRGAAVVVALSGGPDSTALAYLATEARPDLGATLVHVRHGLRDDSDDLAVVERHAAYLGLTLETVAVSVARSGRGLEAAARDARYTALRRVATERGARAILVGHTADDQAETVLLRLARGTGTGGLAAMRSRSGDLVRPLLRLRRADLRRFVALEGLPVATDPTNDDPRFRRVLVRSQVLPRLGEVHPDPVGALGRLAALAAEDDDALRALADVAFTDVVDRCGDVLAVRDDALSRLPAAVQRRLWRRVLADLGHGLPPPAAAIADLLALRPGRRLQIGDLEVTAGGGWRAVAPRRPTSSDPRPLQLPGRTRWAPAGIAIEARTPGSVAADGTATGQIAFELSGAWTPPPPALDTLAPPPGGHTDRCVLALPADVARSPLELRHRRPGTGVGPLAGRGASATCSSMRACHGPSATVGRCSWPATGWCGSPGSWSTPTCSPPDGPHPPRNWSPSLPLPTPPRVSLRRPDDAYRRDSHRTSEPRCPTWTPSPLSTATTSSRC